MREALIQRKIVAALTKAGWLVVKVIQSNLNGFTDLICLKNGRAVFVEVKRPGQKPGLLQEYRHKALRKQNFEVIVAIGLQDVAHLI